MISGPGRISPYILYLCLRNNSPHGHTLMRPWDLGSSLNLTFPFFRPHTFPTPRPGKIEKIRTENGLWRAAIFSFLFLFIFRYDFFLYCVTQFWDFQFVQTLFWRDIYFWNPKLNIFYKWSFIDYKDDNNFWKTIFWISNIL